MSTQHKTSSLPLTADFWHERQVVVLGAARSGIAAARFLKERGNTVQVSDSGPISNATQSELAKLDIFWEEKGHTQEVLMQADVMIVSPGIPLTAQPFQWAQEKGIPVISEIELAGQFLQTPVIAVTGSNGKTTTVTLIHALLEESGLRARLGGNIGTPLISFVGQELDWIVAEISSFQLETTYSFKPRIGLLLNLYPNHLDRHLSMEAYFQIKSRIFQAQDAKDWSLSNADNPWCQTLPQHVRPAINWFSRQKGPSIWAWIEAGQLFRRMPNGSEPVMTLSELPLLGSHNHENALAMLAISAHLNLPLAGVQRALHRIKGISHRLEWVAEIQGRTFINDSKATNYLASQMALESLAPPLILIAGGRDKGGDLQPLLNLILSRVKSVILLGEAAPYFAQELQKREYNQISVVNTMQEAVEQAWCQSQPGDQILLSPACASYDMFQNFEERGEKFKADVAALTP